MIVLSVGLKLVQETKASSAAAKLKAMISVTATVRREGAPQEIAVAQLVPGDVVQLNAGDMVPGDVRIVQAKDLFVSRSSWPVMVMTLAITAVGIAIPFSPVGRYLGFSPLPGLYWPLIAVTLLCYVLVTQGVKMWLLQRRWI
jgi:E1-E2 ATPase